MAKIIPTPQKGQPIDTNYLYQIVDNLNSLTRKILSKSSLSQVEHDGTKEQLRTGDLVFVAGTANVDVTTVAIADEKPFSYSFPVGFQYTPIVTATVVSDQTTGTAGNDASVIITNINKQTVTGIVKFHNAGNVSVSVNIIAVGMPSNPTA